IELMEAVSKRISGNGFRELIKNNHGQKITQYFYSYRIANANIGLRLSSPSREKGADRRAH
ncbi:MAG: hypothetical protein ACLFNS_14625, partial [Desulfobacterales bacterium]